MKRTMLMIMVLMSFTLALACGGGGGGGKKGPALTEFAGDWLGPADDGFFDPFTVEITMDGSGVISVYEIDGGFQKDAVPATFDVEDASSALITFDDGSEGGLFWDDAVEHILFVDSLIDTVGVIEKDAVGLPAYASSDAVGTWAGFAYVPDGAGDFDKESPVIINVASDLSFAGTDPTNSPFSGSFNAALFDSSHGMYVGTIDGPPVDESIQMFLSPDMTFSGGILWEPGASWPDEYIFLVLTKQ